MNARKELLPPLVALLAAFFIATPAAREVTPYDPPSSALSEFSYDELFYDDGEFEFWGTAPGWCSEEQVGFTMPAGGPWTVMAARLWLSGSEPHTLIVREAPEGPGAPPGEVIGTLTFTPGGPCPPRWWVEVDLTPLGLVLPEGASIFVGVTLGGADDAIGLDSTDPDGHSWGFYDSQWYDDTGNWGFDAGIRLGILAGSPATHEATWSSIKALWLE